MRIMHGSRVWRTRSEIDRLVMLDLTFRVTLPLLEETNVAAKQGTIQRTPLNREMVATVSDAVLMGVNRIRAAK